VILLLSLLSGAVPSDSSVLAAADSLLRGQDTLSAVERLQSHMDTVRSSRVVTDLLDRLVLPDDPEPVVPAGENRGNVEARAARALPRRSRWILSAQIGRDEGDELPFWTSLRGVRRSWRNWRGWSGVGEWGVSQLHAEAPSGRLSQGEAIARGEIARGRWQASGNLWLGMDQDLRLEGGVGGAVLRVDSLVFGEVSVGPQWRWSARHASWIGATMRFEENHGTNLLGGVRWRRDPKVRVEGDGILFETAESRLQAFAAFSWLRTLGRWRLGPSLELDWRSSTNADLWQDSLGVVRETSREFTWSAGAHLGVSGAPKWSLRLCPSWVFSNAHSLLGDEDRIVADGLRVSMDGVLVF